MVPVGPGETRYIILHCEPRGDIQARELDADGVPSEVGLFQVLGSGYPVPLRSHGVPGTVQGIPAGWPVWVNVLRKGGGKSGTWKQVVIQRNTMNLVEFQLERQATTELTGRVVDLASKVPLSPVRVIAELVDGPWGVQAQTLTGADGNYSLDLAPGKWQIRVLEQVVAGS